MSLFTSVKYTLLLPAYKASFFRQMLESIKSQTYKEFKVIVSDDCSSEPLQEIFDEVCYGDCRFVFRRNKENLGGRSLVNHWNMLVNMCDTEYLILSSDDDVYAPNFLEEIDKLTIRYPEVDLIHARAQIINAENEIIKKDALYEEHVTQLEFISQYYYLNHIECIANHVFRTKALKKGNSFIDFPLAWASDTATSFIFAKNGVANTKDILFSFRMSGLNLSSDNIENKIITSKKFKAMILYHKYITKLLHNIDTNNKYEYNLKQVVCALHKKHIVSAASYYALSLPLKEFISFIQDFYKANLFENKCQIFQLLKKRCVRH